MYFGPCAAWTTFGSDIVRVATVVDVGLPTLVSLGFDGMTIP